MSLRVFISCLLLFCSGLGIISSHASTHIDDATTQPHCHFKIVSTQVAQTANSNDLAPQVGWKNVVLPHDWDQDWGNYSGTAWYKIIWQRQCNAPLDQFKPAAFLIDRINMAGAVYSNGELLWHDKSLVEPLSRSWNMPRMWTLLPSTIQTGNNEILIKVVGVYTQSSGLNKIQFDSVENITQQHQQLILERRTTYAINLVITLVLGLTGLFIWLFRRKESAFGWFALTSFFWIGFISNILMTKPLPLTDTLMTTRLNIVFLLGYVSCLCLFSWHFAHQKFKKAEYLLLGLGITLSLLILMIPLAYLKHAILFCILYSCSIFLTNCLFFQWIAFKNRSAEILFLAAIFLIFIIIAIHDLIITYVDINAFFWTPFAAPITSLAISCILAWRIAQNINQVELFNQNLSSTVEKVTFDLEQSLSKKYQLEMNNIRLQERLNLSHELHDGLGGSISRSMILLDLNEHVDKAQMMSMLKLLRNDLRQVIDMDSTAGSKVPETPILWAAPIRHRFVQIFEEMEIESIWQIPATWATVPAPLQCLTLARVAEEALNNIVKHSQANQVQVSLIEIENRILILEVQDNGRGFDPLSVQQGFHVGLQSMQVRIKRLGGEFEMHSTQGETTIRAILHI